MPWRSRLIASTRSSRSVIRPLCWASTSRSSSSARRLTAPSRSRSRRQRSRLLSTSAMSGSDAPALSSASRTTSAGATSSTSHDLARDVVAVALGAFEPLFGARGFGARIGHGVERRACGAVGRGERGLAFRQPVGGGAPVGFGDFDAADQGDALFGEGGGRIGEAGTFRLRLDPAALQDGELRLGAGLAFAPSLAIRRG